MASSKRDPRTLVFFGVLWMGFALPFFFIPTTGIALGSVEDIAVMFFIAAAIIWLAPKPTRSIEPGTGGH